MNEQIIEIFPSLPPVLPWFYAWGLEIIRFLQRMDNPVFKNIIAFLTGGGTAYFYLPVIAFVYWCVNEKQGIRFGFIMLLSGWLNLFLKDLFMLPRPVLIDPSIALIHETGYGLPSGHSQSSLVFAFFIALWLCSGEGSVLKKYRKPVWTAAILFPLIIGFSRLYLGVHFPADVLAGYLLAALLLVLYFFLDPHIKNLIEKIIAMGGRRIQNIFAAILVMSMILIYPKDRLVSALLLGICMGYSIMRVKTNFSAPVYGAYSRLPVILLRSFIGFGSSAIIFVLLGMLVPGEGSLFANIPMLGRNSPYIDLGIFVRHFISGLWAAGICPIIFCQMNLSSDNENSRNENS